MSDWIDELQQRPENVIAEAYKEHRAGALVWLMKNYSLERSDALDVFQNAVTALYQNAMLDKISNKGVTLKTYLFAICKNLALKYKTRNKIDYFDILLLEEKGPPENEYEHIEDKIQSCLKGMDQLSKSCRELLKSFYLEGRKIPEITQRYNYSSENSAKTQKYKCLKKLRHLMVDVIPA